MDIQKYETQMSAILSINEARLNSVSFLGIDSNSSILIGRICMILPMLRFEIISSWFRYPSTIRMSGSIFLDFLTPRAELLVLFTSILSSDLIKSSILGVLSPKL